MRAIQPAQPGGPEVLVAHEVATPSPGPGTLLVRIHAAGVNFIDIYQRSGQYKLAAPMALGLEGAGEVEGVGEGVRDFKKGDRVAWASGPGSYATHVVLPQERAVLVPPGVDSKQAAACMLQGMTAHYLVHDTYSLKPGQVCLIHAAAGGVGLLFCQLAKRLGARVLGTTSSEEKAKLAREAGADEIILYTEKAFDSEAKRLTQGDGVHVVYDSVGKDTFEKSLQALRTRGMLVLFGQSSGPVPPIDAQVLSAKGSLYLTRPTLAHYTARREELVERATFLFLLIREGRLKIRIGETFSLDDAAEAHRALAGRKTTGKVLLIPDPSSP